MAFSLYKLSNEAMEGSKTCITLLKELMQVDVNTSNPKEANATNSPSSVSSTSDDNAQSPSDSNLNN